MKTKLFAAFCLVALTSVRAQNLLPVNITSQPTVAHGITEGDVANLAVVATGSAPLQYQWRKNGAAILGKNTAALTLPGVTLNDSGAYDVVVTNPAGSVTSAAVQMAVLSTRFINISTRGLVTPTSAIVAGFIIKGTGKGVLVRAVGPSLAQFGIGDALPNPQLKITNSAGLTIAVNDDWGPDATANLANAFASVGAFPFVSADSKDAAIVMNLTAGSYTAEVTPSDGGLTAGLAKTGTVLIEVYELPAGS